MRASVVSWSAVLATIVGALSAHAEPAPVKPPVNAKAVIDQLPLRFEANHGQTDDRVKFLARGSTYTLFLTQTEIVLSGPADVVRMSFRGGRREPRLVPVDQLPGATNILLGADPSQWRRRIPGFAKVRYEEIYPGIDLVFYGNNRQLEYDLIVHPGADPRSIQFALDGAQGLSVESDGDLVARTSKGNVRLRKPIIYQASADSRGSKTIDGKYKVRGSTVSFDVGKYDSKKPLVIDPILMYQSYLGGDGDDRLLFGTRMITVDADGYSYVTGSTGSSNFPTTPGTVRPTPFTSRSETEDGREPCVAPGPFGPGGPENVFVAKITPDGSSLVYGTYIGGTYSIFDHHCGAPFDGAAGIDVDAFGNAYITGSSLSEDYPGDSYPNGSFVTKLDPTGSSIVYSRRFGSQGASAIAVGPDGSAYVTGQNDSAFPASPWAFQPDCGGIPLYGCIPSVFGQGVDAFVLKVAPSGLFEYATFLGGLGLDRGTGITVDSLGQASVTGLTRSSDFPVSPGTPIPADINAGGAINNLFVTKLNATGTGVIFSTYLGGLSSEQAGGIAGDADGNVYVAGSTNSYDLPTTPGSYQPFFPPSPSPYIQNNFVTKYGPGGDVQYSTFIGHAGSGFGGAIAVDGQGRAILAGGTESNDYPTVNPIRGARCECQQPYLTVLDPTGSALEFSSYLDGGYVQSVAVSPSGDAYVLGIPGNDLPPVNALQPTPGGGGDVFIAKIVFNTVPAVQWPQPAGITYGTALDSAQLNASADMAGVFEYDPPAGTILHAGAGQQLHVTFTPTDSRFSTVDTSVLIDVATAPLSVLAESKSKVFGAPVPALTAQFADFVNGDTPANLSGTLALATPATQTSPAGSYPITVGGVTSSDYDIQFVPGTLTIGPASTTATLVALPSSVGTLQPILVAATVAAVAPGAGVPDGTVQFVDGLTTIGTASVVNGTSVLFVNGLAAGVHSLTAVYSGSGNFTGTTSTPASVTVRSPAASTYTFLIEWTNPSAVGQAAIISAAVVPLGGAGPTPTGSVRFLVDGAVVATSPIVNGLATMSTNGLAPGIRVITAQYLGNVNFAASSAPLALQTVYAGARPASTTVSITSAPTPSLLGQPVTFTATLTSSGAPPLGAVYFFADGVPIGGASVAPVGGSFKGSFTTSALSSGAHVITAVYTGSSAAATSNSAPILQTVQ